MGNRKLVLGIDTSNYTTSLCLVCANSGEIVAETRRLLPVKAGERGLRQSDALFFHVQHVPELAADLMQQARSHISDELTLTAIGVSVRPRPMAKSYMPVFRAGESFANTMAQLLRIPVVRTSHQEGHLAAAHWFCPDVPSAEPFIAVHLSGGTSDVLLAQQSKFGYRVHALADGADLHAGQFVDRVGVALGLPFPAGPAMEVLAKEAEAKDVTFGVRLVDGRLSFSGPCTAAMQAVERGANPADIAYGVLTCVANAVSKAIVRASEQNPSVKHCIVAGGVASNAYIRERVIHRLQKQAPHLNVQFAPSKFASDNAFGVAVITVRHCSEVCGK